MARISHNLGVVTNKVTKGGQNAAIAKSGGSQTLTEEIIEAVNSNGTYRVRGVSIPAAGQPLGLAVGQSVIVSWEKGQPRVIIAHSARRAKPISPMISTAGGVVEELLIATDATGTVEIWFRNDHQVTNLRLRAVLGEDPMEVGWGAHPSAFYVRTSAHVYHVFTVNRPSRDGVLGTTAAVATRQYIADPFDGTFELCTFASADTLTGTNKYIDFDWPSVLAPGTLLLGPEVTYTKTTTQSGSLFLKKIHIDGQTNPPGPLRAPMMLITGVTIDDALDLIITLSLDLAGSVSVAYGGPAIVRGGSELIPQLGALFLTTDPLPENHGRFFYPITGSVDTGLDPLSTQGSGFSGGGHQVAIINARQRTVVFRSFKPNVTWAKTRKLDNFNYAKTIAGVLTKGLAFANTSGHLLSLSVNMGSPTLSLTYDIGTTIDIPRTTGASSDVWDPAVVPFFDLPETTFTEALSPIINQWGARALGSSGFSSSEYPFVNTYATSRTASNRSFRLAAVYIPRRATLFDATGAPVGLKLGKVILTAFRSESANPFTISATPTVGCFIRDLDTGGMVTLQPLTTNWHGGQGVNLVPPGIFFSAPTVVARQYVTVLGATLSHTLWVHIRQATSGGPEFADILLSNITTGVTKILLTGAADVIVGGDPTLAQSLLDFCKRAFQLLRPNFAYYPDLWKLFVDAADGKANNFITAWSATGVPTLNPTAVDFPPTVAVLKSVASLLALPRGTLPQQDTIIANNLGPVNIDQTKTGPSWHVVNDRSKIPSSQFQQDV